MKSFISILGTGNYLECRHTYNDIKTHIPVKYVQEDLINLFCNDWSKDNSEIRIFLTEDAEKTNWLDDGHKNRDGSVSKNFGLKSRLERNGVESTIKTYPIPSAENEKEVWEIFEKIFDAFTENEEVIVDITHAFRTLPMLLIILLNYAKQMKNIKVKGIYYGALEALGNLEYVKSLEPEKRIVPIFDLTPFSKLQDWSIATFDFLQHGNPKSLRKTANEELQKKILSDQQKELKRLMKNLNQLADNIALCRGKELIEFDYKELRKNIENQKSSDYSIKPFNPLFDKILDKIRNFENSEIKNGLAAIDWCLEHNLYQQAITLIQETVITYVLSKTKYDWKEKIYRNIASSSIQLLNENKLNPKQWKNEAGKYPDITKKIMSLDIVEKLKKDYSKLTYIRNKVNHGGFSSDDINTDKIISKTNFAYKEIKKIIEKDIKK